MNPNEINTDERLQRAGLDPEAVRALVRATLDEDLSWGPDVTTTATITPEDMSTARMVSRESGVLSAVVVAVVVAEELARRDDTALDCRVLVEDGTAIEPGDAVLEVTGPTRTILTAERTMLNLVCQLSGVATATRAWVSALHGTQAVVRDTRKTVPGLRVLQKYAVRCGGGANHRMGLGDAALIKDNHVAATGSITAAFEAVRAAAPGIEIEVECDTLAQVGEAITAGARTILLDNMDPAQLREAVALAADHPEVTLEASGGLTLENAAAVAATGVDFIAVGALTHSAPALDLGLDLGPDLTPSGRRPLR